MAISDLHRASALPLGTRVALKLGGGVHAVMEWHRARQTRRILSRLSDHELHDIGLSRSDIPRLF